MRQDTASYSGVHLAEILRLAGVHLVRHPRVRGCARSVRQVATIEFHQVP